jgi:RNA polymerase sigma factor (sigma-70 family)
MADVKLQIQRILKGDKAAFRALVEQHQRLVSHIVFRIVSHKEDREDTCQEVFLKIYQNLGNFRSESKLSTWIAKIAYNTCIDYLGKRKLTLLSELGSCGDDLSFEEKSFESFSEDNKQPDKLLDKREISLLLQVEIDRMPVHFRTILTLYHLDGMSYYEIGEILSLPEGTVKSYLFRARRLLKERLLAKYQLEDLCH